MRRFIVAATAAAFVVAMALPASADPDLSIDNNNGRRVNVRVENPDNHNCFVTVTLDIHFGFAATGDSGPEFASPVSWVADGPCAKRFQVDNQRTRISGFGPTGVVNDFFSAKQSNPRNNTGLNCWDVSTGGTVTRDPGGSIHVSDGATASLFDERAPKDGECETEADEVKNPLHNVFDYAPDTSLVKAYGDWVAISGEGAVQQRTFLTVQWDGAPGVPNWSITRHNILSGTAIYGA